MNKLSIVFVAGLGLAWVAPTGGSAVAASVAASVAACEDDSGLCLESGVSGAKWQSERASTKKQRKKRSNKRAGTVSMDIDDGRGSLFINGRYAGTAPLSDAKIPAGANDIQVRDGARVLAEGLLTVPRGASLSISIAGA